MPSATSSRGACRTRSPVSATATCLVRVKGARCWRFDYRCEGRRKTLALGVYPDVSLAMVRDRRDEDRRQVASGIDPAAARKAEKEPHNGTQGWD